MCKIVRAEAAQGKTNQGTLCLKGYYGWDFINDTQILTPRLKTPMIRRERGGKLEAVSWNEALDYVATRLSAIKAKYGPDAIQTTGSSRGTGNETNYVMQKFARAVIGTNKRLDGMCNNLTVCENQTGPKKTSSNQPEQ